MKRYGLHKSTEKASLVVSTEGCSFMGLSVFASAACTITVVDGTANLLGPYILAATQYLHIHPVMPVACTSGLSVTNSGGGYYTVFYGNR